MRTKPAQAASMPSRAKVLDRRGQLRRPAAVRDRPESARLRGKACRERRRGGRADRGRKAGLVLLDWLMPLMDGGEVLGKLGEQRQPRCRSSSSAASRQPDELDPRIRSWLTKPVIDRRTGRRRSSGRARGHAAELAAIRLQSRHPWPSSFSSGSTARRRAIDCRRTGRSRSDAIPATTSSCATRKSRGITPRSSSSADSSSCTIWPARTARTSTANASASRRSPTRAKVRMGNTYGRFSEELPTENDGDAGGGAVRAAAARFRQPAARVRFAAIEVDADVAARAVQPLHAAARTDLRRRSKKKSGVADDDDGNGADPPTEPLPDLPPPPPARPHRRPARSAAARGCVRRVRATSS